MDTTCLRAGAARLALELVRHSTKETHRIWRRFEPENGTSPIRTPKRKGLTRDPSPTGPARVLVVFDRCPQLVG